MITVSVVIPSYNHAKYIKETLFSCLEQDYEGFIQIIIVDDSSTDDTKNVLEALDFTSYVNRSVSIIYKEMNQGINDSIDRGLCMVNGKYIQLLASDDVLCSNKISKQVAFLEKYHYDCVYSRGFTYKNGASNEFYLENFKKMYLLNKGLEFVSIKDWGGPLTQSGLFTLKLLLDLKDIRCKYQSDDWAMLITIFKKYNPGYYDEPVFLYRLHDDNTHNKYWSTLPMRIDVASRLVDDCYKMKALSNILSSHANSLLSDKKRIDSLRFIAASNIMSFNSSASKVLLRFFLPHKAWSILMQGKKYLNNSINR